MKRLEHRLTQDHRDTIECEHGFMLHRSGCPNEVCLGRDLAEASERLLLAEELINDLCGHEGAEGFSVSTNELLEKWNKE